MGVEGYYCFDIIQDKDDNYKILDIHGLSDAVSFTESAGYHPRMERVRRFVKGLSDKAYGKDIVYVIYADDVNPLSHILPENVTRFYDTLPEGSIHLQWMKKYGEFLDRIENNASGTSLLKKELDLIDEAAKNMHVTLDLASLVAYGDTQMIYYAINPRTRTEDLRRKPYEDIGLVVTRGNEFLLHPSAGYLWVDETRSLPSINSVSVSYILDIHNPRWYFRNIVEDESTSNCFPKEAYVGGGIHSSDQIQEISNSFKSRPISAVLRPLSSHCGVDISYLKPDEVRSLVRQQQTLDDKIQLIRSRMLEAMEQGFAYTDKDKENNAFDGYFYKSDGTISPPIVELGSYVLQEFIDAKPMKSIKTGMMHQGIIRVQMLGDNIISAMHRFARKESKSGLFVPLTDFNNRTFYERTSDTQETELQKFLMPLIETFEEFCNKYTPSDLSRLSSAIVNTYYEN